MKRCGIHWDSLGNSKGTADLEFYKAEDASKAIEEYHSNLSYFLLIFIYFLEARINDEVMEVKFSNGNVKNISNNNNNGDRRIVIRKHRLGGNMNFGNRRGNNRRFNN